MKKKIILITILCFAAFLMTGYFVYIKWGTWHRQNSQLQSADSDIDFYHCGMHPWIKSDKLGKCPICGMTLTPVYKNGTTDTSMENMVMIDPAMVQNIGVKTEVVTKRKLTHIIRTTGIVDYDETKQTYITTKFSGYIEKLYVDYTGKQVEKEQPLFEIYSPELVAAQQEYLQAIAYKKNISQSNNSSAITGAEELVQSAKRKLSLWDISNNQIEQLEQSGGVKKTLTVYSPFSGIVIEKNIFDGMQVQAGMNLLKLADINKMWVYADVYENELSWVKIGEEVELALPDNSQKTFQGKIFYIPPYVQEQSRTAKVRIEFPNTNSVLKKDMYVTVNIKPNISLNAIAVPEQSVIHSGTRDIVVKAMGEGKFMSMNVTLGVLADGYYEVKEGLNEGDTIVTSSQFLIDSESNLKAGTSAMSNMPGMKMDSKSGEQKNDMQNMSDSAMQNMKMK